MDPRDTLSIAFYFAPALGIGSMNLMTWAALCCISTITTIESLSFTMFSNKSLGEVV